MHRHRLSRILPVFATNPYMPKIISMETRTKAHAIETTRLQTIFIKIRISVFRLFTPGSPEKNPVQLVKISTAEREITVKNTVSRIVSISRAETMIRRYPVIANIMCKGFFARNPGGGNRQLNLRPGAESVPLRFLSVSGGYGSCSILSSTILSPSS